MSCTTKSQTFKLEAVKAFWGTKQCREITTVADVAGSLEDTYFDLNVISATGLVESLGYVYFDTDPVIAGKTGYLAARTNGDSANVIAQNVIAALPNTVIASAVGNVITITNKYIGGITIETDSGSTGFTFNVGKVGIGGELGKTAQGGTTLSMEAQGVEIKSDQTGEIILAEVYVGTSASFEMPLIEIDSDKLELLLGQVTGDVLTPSGGTALVGFGESKLYQLLNDLGGSLILHPISLPDSDRSRDVICHKCAPMPQDINFSGTDVQTMNLTFKAYLDQDVNKKINLFAFGDWAQDLA